MALGAPPIAISTNWITSRNFDLFWYIAACICSYLCIFLNVELGIPAVLLWWFWILSVDGPHVFATVSRTYLDSQEWKIRSRLLLGSLLWFVLGPFSVLVGILTGTRVSFLLFLTFAELWAYWHVVRQHYGFMVLYQKKNGELAGTENKLDYWIFYTLMIAPFFSFLLRHPEAREQIGLGPTLTGAEPSVLIALHVLIAVALILYVGKEIYNSANGAPLNLPKNAFLAACIPLHLFIFLHPYISTHIELLLFVVFVTFYHNIQYHGIVWFYNRNRYGKDPEGKQFGPAGFVSRNFLIYYAAGILFTLIYRYSGWFFLGVKVPLAPGPNAVSEMYLGPLFQVKELAFAFWWGFAFNHYYLDQKIWRLSKDKQLNRELKLA